MAGHLSSGSAAASHDRRLRVAGALLLLVFAGFLLRLFQLQILEGEELRRRSKENFVRTLQLRAPRGEIVDREGRVLATTRPAYELQVIPGNLERPDVTYAALGQLLAAEPAALRERVGPARGAARYRPVRLVGDLDFDALARVESHRYALPGVVTDVQPRRHYLDGALGAHLLGTIGEIRSDQLEKDAYQGYRAGDVIGQTGLEARLEAHLRGRDGGRNVVVDVSGRVVEVLDEIPPVPGGRAVLALDLDLQRAAEDAFLDVPEGEPPKMGAAVALDTRTGDVLAMVSRPAYDPNAFAGGIDAATWKALSGDEWQPLQNRAIQNHYPPGSTHKAIVAAAALTEHVITPHTRVFCPGFYRHGGRVYRCWKKGGHGSVDLHRALRESCDVFFYTAGVQLQIDRMARHARSFGLGQRTGIGLAGEAPGLVPSSEWKRKRFGEPWYPGETVSASIGQGYNLYTPLQLAVAYAAIGNGGHVLRPRLLLRLESRDGASVEEFPPEEVGRTLAPPEVLAQVLDGLTAVVEEPGGTGARARVPGLRVAGKTGTAQVVRLQHVEGLKEHEIPLRYRDHGWFAALAPAESPEIAVAVFVEHGLHGSSAAGPVAQRVLAAWQAKRAPAPVPRVAGAKGEAGARALD
jgi:penicillin-binding protein 2